MTTVHIYHCDIGRFDLDGLLPGVISRVPRDPAYSYETDRADLEQIFRDNNAVDGDPETEVNVRMKKRSLSVGDVVQIGDEFWKCEIAGWTQLTKEEVWS